MDIVVQGPAGVIGEDRLHTRGNFETAYRNAIDKDENGLWHGPSLSADLARSIEYNDFYAFISCLEQLKVHPDPRTILMANYAIHAAAAKTDIRWLIVLLQTASSVLDPDSMSMIVNAFIDKGEVGPEYGFAPIHTASKHGSARHLQLLLDYGANPDALNNVDPRGLHGMRRTGLQISIHAKNYGAVRFWAENRPHLLDARLYGGRTPLRDAVSYRVPAKLFSFILHQMQRLELDLMPEDWMQSHISSLFANLIIPIGVRMEYFRLLLRADPHFVTYANLDHLFSTGQHLDRHMAELAIAASDKPCSIMPEELRLRIREDVFFYSLLERLLEWA